MAYILRYDEIYEAHLASSAWLDGSGRGSLIKDISVLQSSYERFFNDTIEYTGNTANRLKSYLAEGPYMAAMLLMELISQYSECETLYAGGLLEYDTSPHFRLNHDVLADNEK
jgi:hypothetical protein